MKYDLNSNEYKQKAIKRFNKLVSKPDKNGCRFWKGATDQKGYGLFKYQNKVIRSHIFYYKVIMGKEIPEGMQLAHFCQELGSDKNNKGCVCHIIAATQEENFAMDRGGENHPSAKISDALAKQVIKFYLKHKKHISQEKIAEALIKAGYKANRVTITNWINGKYRKELTE